MYLPSPGIKGPSILIVFSIKVHSSEWSKYFAALWNNIVFKMNISVCTPEYPTNYVTSNTENKGFSLSLGGSYARAAAPQYHRPLDRVLWVVLCSSGTAASAQSSWWSWPENYNICHILNCAANRHLQFSVILRHGIKTDKGINDW